MTDTQTEIPDRWDPEPRWPAVIAILAVAGLSVVLPPALVIISPWWFLLIIAALIIATALTHWRKYHTLDRFLGFTISGVLTLWVIASVVLLIAALPGHKETPAELLSSAAILWATNVLVFSLWYWRLDAGGPHGRDSRFGHHYGAFLFPQMTLPPETKKKAKQQGWSPNFVDYLFLAFNTSTAFSPTDVPVLERWAKVIMMTQSVISLTVLALLAARAVNIL
jgi:hypothetical protein